MDVIICYNVMGVWWCSLQVVNDSFSSYDPQFLSQLSLFLLLTGG